MLVLWGWQDMVAASMYFWFFGEGWYIFEMGLANSCKFLELVKYLLYLCKVIFMDFTFGQCEGLIIIEIIVVLRLRLYYDNYDLINWTQYI